MGFSSIAVLAVEDLDSGFDVTPSLPASGALKPAREFSRPSSFALHLLCTALYIAGEGDAHLLSVAVYEVC